MNGYDQLRCKKTQVVFCFFNILGLVFCIEKSQTQKQNWVFCFFWYLDWSYPFKKTKTTQVIFWFFHFKTKKPTEHKKNNLLSQNQTFSQKFFIWWSSLFFWFVYWFTWLPFVSLCLLTLLVLGSQTLTKVSHSRACALCETKLGIGCAVMFMHLKISCCNAFLLYL